MRLAWCGTGVMVVSAGALAAPIAIVNPSFEADFAPDGNYVVLNEVQGWDLYDPNDLRSQGTNVIGVICPIGSGYYTPGVAPDGRNFALVFILDNIEEGPMGLEQGLGVELQPGTVYTLEVAIGNIAQAPGVAPNPPDEFPINGFPGYAIQLLAGGVVIGEDVNSIGPGLADGASGEASCVVTTGPSVTSGLELTIRLLSLNQLDTPDPGVEVNFDDVRLDASPVAPGTCIADFDADLDTDVLDFSVFAAGFGMGVAPFTGGDFDGDGVVSVLDFGTFVAEFGCGP